MQTSQDHPHFVRRTPAAEESSAEHRKKTLIELDNLMCRIESSNICYQVLNVERVASLEQIHSAYQQIVNLLFPSYSIGALIPLEIKTRMERAADKAYQAFKTLASGDMRSVYDQVTPTKEGKIVADSCDQRLTAQALRSNPSLPSAAGALPTDNSPVNPEKPGAQRQPSVTATANKPPSVNEHLQHLESKGSRRRTKRIKLSIPVRMVGHDRKQGKWQEVTETIDLSRTGLNLRSRKYLRHGTVVYLSLPLPDKLRSHAYGAPSYTVYALVRRVGTAKNGMRVIGLEFIGAHPPTGYLEKPWMVFRTKSWSGGDRRRMPRKSQTAWFNIAYFGEEGRLLSHETAQGEDMNSNGMRLCVRTAPTEFEFVRVTSSNRVFDSFAKVCNRFVGKDGRERLCLEFIDALPTFQDSIRQQ